MDNWITEIMSQFGYLGVLLLIMLENIFPPIPSEIILTFGGYMTTQTDLTKAGVIIAATIGSVVGAMVLYSAGMLLDVERLEKIVDRWGSHLRLKRKDIYRADAWFDKYGPWTVLFCRVIPLLRSLISIPAGMSNMNFFLFITLTSIGSLVWNGALVLMGAALGENWQLLVQYMDIYSNFVYVIIGISGITVSLLYLKTRGKRV